MGGAFFAVNATPAGIRARVGKPRAGVKAPLPAQTGFGYTRRLRFPDRWMCATMRQLLADRLKEALKAREARKVSTLRLILAALKDRDIQLRGEGKEPASEDDILQLLQKMIKQRNESIGTYESAARLDLAEQEREEKAIIESFLPKQMDEAEVKAAIAEVAAEIGAAGIKDMGKVMAELKARFAGRMDFAKASGAVKALLAG
jgi:uncharacterized protein